MKLLWAVDGWRAGNAYGMSVHRRKLKEALLAAGVTITVDPRDDFDLAVHVQVPNHFEPIPDKRNLLFTATELSEPLVWGETVKEAAVLCVPCEQNRAVVKKYFAGPVEVCPEGIDPVLFPFHERKQPGPDETFRFLFVGNDAEKGSRKGFHIVLAAFQDWARSGKMPKNCELYIKTSDLPGPEFRTIKVPGAPVLVVDTRNLPVAELVALYNSAHAFLLPSQGEGWGLTLTDAMATGCPSVWTHCSAMLDYADATIGFPITEFKLSAMRCSREEPGANPKLCYGAEVSTLSLIEKMEELYHDYDRALARGKAASERMHSRYTWAQAATRFIEICERAALLPILPAPEIARVQA